MLESHNLEEKFDTHVLGQLGGVLTAEMNNSAFQRHRICLGLLCTRLEVLYTALNSPSLIFALKRPETDSPSLAFAQSPIFFQKPLYIIQLAQF